MENVIIDGVSIGKVLHNGKGMCFKAKEMMLNSLKDGKEVVIIDPESEWKDISKMLGDRIEYSN